MSTTPCSATVSTFESERETDSSGYYYASLLISNAVYYTPTDSHPNGRIKFDYTLYLNSSDATHYLWIGAVGAGFSSNSNDIAFQCNGEDTYYRQSAWGTSLAIESGSHSFDLPDKTSTTISKTMYVNFMSGSPYKSVRWPDSYCHRKATSFSFGITAHTLTISKDAGISSVSPSGTTTHRFGETVSITATPSSNLLFSKWSDGSTSASRKITLTSNVSLTAYSKYSVTYNKNHGTAASTVKYTQYGTSHKFISSPWSVSGYTMQRWNTNSAGTGTNRQIGSSATLNVNTVLYGVWTADYTEPCATSLPVVQRCDSSGNASDTGEYARIDIAWKRDSSLPRLRLTVKSGSSDSRVKLSGGSFGDYVTLASAGSGATTGAATVIVKYTANSDYGAQYSYTLTVTMTDGNSHASSVSTFLSKAAFIIDIAPGNDAGTTHTSIGLGTAVSASSSHDEGVLDIAYVARIVLDDADQSVGQNISTRLATLGWSACLE